MIRFRGKAHRRKAAAVLAVVASAAVCTLPVSAQSLRFSNHREVQIPEYATIRIGPFYSTMIFSQSAGYRYTRGSGVGTDFLFANRRGTLLKDGADLPLVTRLNFRNYLLITRHTDLDISLFLTYEHFPWETQKDEFFVDLAEEGAIGNLSMEFALTPFVKVTAYDRIAYRTDFIDTRGVVDLYGGQRYEHFMNTGGFDIDWLAARDRNLGLSISRTDSRPMDETFENQESVSYKQSASYEQRISPFIVAGVKADFIQTAYAVTNRADPSMQNYSIYSTAKLTRHTHGRTAVGYSIGTISSPIVTGEKVDWGIVSGQLSLETQLSKELSHSIKYSRGLRTAYSSAFEALDSYIYEIGWKGELASARFRSGLSVVESGRRSENAYSDWSSDLNVSYPLASYLTLLISTSYNVRENKDIITEGADEEWRTDYNTWSGSVGTTVEITRNIKFATNLRRIQRDSDSGNLDYERDIFTALFTYKHQF